LPILRFRQPLSILIFTTLSILLPPIAFFFFFFQRFRWLISGMPDAAAIIAAAVYAIADAIQRALLC
jgi:hypothetical protein